MSVASQLFQLQEIDSGLNADEQSVSRIGRQLDDRSALNDIQSKLGAARQHLEGLTKEQRNLEWEIDDLSSKMKSVEKELYGGRVRNPKELTDLQHEDELLKARRAQLEDKDLSLMEQVELTTKSISALDNGLKKAESEWQSQHKQLTADLEKLRAAIAGLKQKRETLVAGIDPQEVAVYQEVKKQRGTAVARVEQGLCTGCRITLPVTEFQRARSGALVRCSSCGRILFLA